MSIRRGADVHFVVSLHDLIGFLAMCPGIVVRDRVELTITARRDPFTEPASLIAFQHPLNSTFGAASAACQPASLRHLAAQTNSAKTRPMEDQNCPLNSVASHIIYVCNIPSFVILSFNHVESVNFCIW